MASGINCQEPDEDNIGKLRAFIGDCLQTELKPIQKTLKQLADHSENKRNDLESLKAQRELLLSELAKFVSQKHQHEQEQKELQRDLDRITAKNRNLTAQLEMYQKRNLQSPESSHDDPIHKFERRAKEEEEDDAGSRMKMGGKDGAEIPSESDYESRSETSYEPKYSAPECDTSSSSSSESIGELFELLSNCSPSESAEGAKYQRLLHEFPRQGIPKQTLSGLDIVDEEPSTDFCEFQSSQTAVNVARKSIPAKRSVLQSSYAEAICDQDGTVLSDDCHTAKRIKKTERL
ncbi:hypothetical protein BS50DRAFT_100172 [Corynespora cassiicola Philippines]|uniref:Uncharacterized protein n=1 Tax=Corynespora cassiicola Philippines TaxID=1448308 RepID=A0A2T2MZR8_CORCC|nr:hypothetical protein BS50DRAFT_100172 [Corynespora cassiicola Philippines]